jgi:hypothetical protein
MRHNSSWGDYRGVLAFLLWRWRLPNARPANPYRLASRLREALTLPDPARVSGPVKRYAPDGLTLLETVSTSDWQARYPRRHWRRRASRPSSRGVKHPPAEETGTATAG